jgi:hypothetical protein
LDLRLSVVLDPHHALAARDETPCASGQTEGISENEKRPPGTAAFFILLQPTWPHLDPR